MVFCHFDRREKSFLFLALKIDEQKEAKKDFSLR